MNTFERKSMGSFCVKGETVSVYSLGMADFELVWGFYEREIALLDNPADFYPYKREELESILAGNGVFIGGFVCGELAGVCGIDYDESYQEGIKKANEAFPSFPFSDTLLEFSGLFVARKHRGKGISEGLTAILLEFAKVNLDGKRLFAVVLDSNIASMKNFFHFGFKLYGWWQMDEEFRFVYLISGGDEAVGNAVVPLCELVERLKEGAVFGGVDEDGEFLGARIKGDT